MGKVTKLIRTLSLWQLFKWIWSVAARDSMSQIAWRLIIYNHLPNNNKMDLPVECNKIYRNLIIWISRHTKTIMIDSTKEPIFTFNNKIISSINKSGRINIIAIPAHNNIMGSGKKVLGKTGNITMIPTHNSIMRSMYTVRKRLHFRLRVRGNKSEKKHR